MFKYPVLVPLVLFFFFFFNILPGLRWFLYQYLLINNNLGELSVAFQNSLLLWSCLSIITLSIKSIHILFVGSQISLPIQGICLMCPGSHSLHCHLKTLSRLWTVIVIGFFSFVSHIWGSQCFLSQFLVSWKKLFNFFSPFEIFLKWSPLYFTLEMFFYHSFI